MPGVAAGDVSLLTFVGSLNGQTIMNTFHFGQATVTGAPTQNAVSAELMTAIGVAGGFRDKFLDCCPGNYSLDHIWHQFILDTRYRKYTISPGLNGNYSSDSQAPNLSTSITRYGAAANRYNVGAIHIPAPSTDPTMSNGVLPAALQTAMVVFSPYLYQVINLATLGTLQPILIHGTSKLNAIPLIGAEVQPTVRVMRRRTVGLGI